MHPIHEYLLHANLVILYSPRSLSADIFDTFVSPMKIIIPLLILFAIYLASLFITTIMESQ